MSDVTKPKRPRDGPKYVMTKSVTQLGSVEEMMEKAKSREKTSAKVDSFLLNG